MKQRMQPGYYPGYSTLSQQEFWDEATRRVVLRRLEPPPPIRFFTAEEARTMEAVVARVLPQDDRVPERRIPILPVLDKRLHEGTINGYRYEDMPSDREAYKLAAAMFERAAQRLHRKGFADLSDMAQEEILKSIHDGEPPVADEVWERMNIQRFWTMLVQDCIEAYYAHPWSWDEVGFGGPAYPRAYMRLEGGKPEPWEVDEQRYEWSAPENSLSDRYEPVGGRHAQETHMGQEGTH